MRKLLLFISFLLLQSSLVRQLHAQCDNYLFYLDATGFSCDENEGEICFITNFDLPFPAIECAEHLVEISYPNGSFQVNELNDFTISNTSTTTTLTLLPNINTGFADIVHCLEGELLVPNTNFVLSIVSPTNPMDIVETTVFQLDNTVNIGAADETTLLSDLVGGPLALPNVSGITGQRLRIEGTLIVDLDYGFGATINGFKSNLTFGENASIETLTGQPINLRFFRSNLYSCEGGSRWRGIVINEGDSEVSLLRTSVDRADIGVDMRADARLNMAITGLNNNRVGISSTGNDFRNVDIVTPVFVGARPFIQNCNIGLDFDGVENIFLQWINFRDNQTAINISRTNTFLGNDLNLNGNATGIEGDEQVRNFSLFDSELTEGNTAIELLTYSILRIIDNDIMDHTTGIRLLDNRINARGFIEDNEIRTALNILAFQRRGSMRVSGNELIGDGQNITVFGNFGGGHRWRIFNNTTLFAGLNSPAFGNTVLVGMEEARIFNNPVVIADGGPSINIFGGENNTVSFNNIDASDDNIRLTGSALNTISCNTTDRGTGLRIFNDCIGTDIRGNDFSNSNDQNLIYGDDDNTMSLTGLQAFRGNIFTLSTPETPVTTHFGDALMVEFNRYFVNENNVQGNNLFPHNEAPIVDWFIGLSPTDDFECDEGFNNPETTLEKKTNSALNEYLVYPYLEDIYNSNIASATELRGANYRLDITAQGDLLSEVISTYNNNQDDPYGQLISNWNVAYGNYAHPDLLPERAIDLLTPSREAAAKMKLSSNENQALTSLLSEIQTTQQNLLSLEPVLSISSDGDFIFDETVFQEQAILRDQLIASQLSYDHILDTKETSLREELPALMQANSEADAEGKLPYEVKKYVDGIAFKQLFAENYMLTEEEAGRIEAYANLCAAEGGESVYLARALLAQHLRLPKLDYNDHCTNNPVSPQSLSLETTNDTSVPAIYPNPSQDVSWLKLSIDHDYRMMMITDVNGTIVQSKPIDTDVQNIRINEERWPSGLYIVTLFSESTSTSLRFIIQ